MPAREAYSQAAAAVGMARNVGDDGARAELLAVAESYGSIGERLERLAR